ncbi:MAG: phosphoglycerate dehydrogenase [Planctomycetia bacterium]|nr:phosphoglycerate dehydrogenase [Planctomycetia bacterium]
MTHATQRLKVALVYLDGQGVPGWVPESLEREGIELTIGECATRAELAQHGGDADVVWLFGGGRVLNGNLDAIPRCWAILRTGSGTDNVPVEDATGRGIVVANTPAAHSDAVADHVIGLMFAVVRRIAALDRAVRAGRWDQVSGEPLNSIQGRTLGLVGFGHIARELARKLSGFAMKVLAYDPYVDAETMAAHAVEPVELATLLPRSDFVSLHCPLTPRTKSLIGEKELRSMKSTAVLINTSRGPVVDERALQRALAEGWIAAAGLDVIYEEPPAPDHPFFQFENVVLTPHSAGISAGGLELRWRLSIETLVALAGRRWPPSCVNPDVQPRQSLSA